MHMGFFVTEHLSKRVPEPEMSIQLENSSRVGLTSSLSTSAVFDVQPIFSRQFSHTGQNSFHTAAAAGHAAVLVLFKDFAERIPGNTFWASPFFFE